MRKVRGKMKGIGDRGNWIRHVVVKIRGREGGIWQMRGGNKAG